MDQPPSPPPSQPPPPDQPPPFARGVEGGFAPPTQPFAPAAPPPKAPTWVRAIGIIAVIFGSLGVANGLCGAGSSFLMKPFLAKMGGTFSEGADTFAWMEKWKTTILMSAAIAAVLGVFLIVGGARLLKCRHGAPKLLKTWAGAKIAFVIVNSVMQFGMQGEQMEQMRRQAAGTPAALGMQIGQYGGFVIGVLWGATLPVLILIWFSRAKIKAEVAQWT